jgi:prevent-host-death family protein
MTMRNIAAREAKTHFGELLDTAQREPVTIEKHGRAVAVVMSTVQFQELEDLRIERLKAEIQKGLDQLDSGQAITVDEQGLTALITDVKAEARRSRDP